MKRSVKRIVISLCILSLLCSSALAATEASSTINSFETNAYHSGGGTISILVSVFAKDYMERLGASHVYVYEKVGSAWIIYDSFTQTDPGMTSTDSAMHHQYVSCDAYTGGEFKVDVIIFAKSYSGESTSRSETHYVYT